MQLEMKPIGASMGYEATNTGFCVTRVDAGLPFIKGEANLVQHRTPVASQCLVALQHLDTRILVELSWVRIPQTNVKKATSPKDPNVIRVPGGTVITRSGRFSKLFQTLPNQAD